MSSLKKFHWHFKFSCKTIQSILSQMPLIVGGNVWFNFFGIYFFTNVYEMIKGKVNIEISVFAVYNELNIWTSYGALYLNEKNNMEFLNWLWSVDSIEI